MHPCRPGRLLGKCWVLERVARAKRRDYMMLDCISYLFDIWSCDNHGVMAVQECCLTGLQLLPAACQPWQLLPKLSCNHTPA
jgi:hypothetical protein